MTDPMTTESEALDCDKELLLARSVLAHRESSLKLLADTAQRCLDLSKHCSWSDERAEAMQLASILAAAAASIEQFGCEHIQEAVEQMEL